MKIYILRDKQEQGPFTLPEIFAGLTNGTFSSDDQARKEGGTEWKKLDDLIKDGAFLFSVDQIQQIREEEALEPCIIPDLQPLRPIHSNIKGRTKRRLSPVPVAAIVLFAMVAVVLVHWWSNRSTEDSAFPPAVTIEGTPTTASQPSPSVIPPLKKEVASISVPPPVIIPPTPAPSTPIPNPSTIAISPSASPSPVALSAQPSQSPESKIGEAQEDQRRPSANPRETKPIAVAQQSTPDSAPSPSAIPSFTPQPTMASKIPPSPTPASSALFVSDFFKIDSIQLLKKEPKTHIGVWHENPKIKVPPEFRQCLEIKVSARENTRSDQTIARAYFFDDRYKKIAFLDKPSPSGKPKGKLFPMPILFYKDKPDSIFFEIPKEVNSPSWKAVIVFGDMHELHSVCYPPTETDFMMDYPEKRMVHDPKKLVSRKPAMDPLIQYEVKTKNLHQPKITLFLRPPKAISSADDINGVLCLCILAGSIDDIKRELQKEEMSGDYNGLLGFANAHKLAILAWGSTRLWNPGANFEDLPKEQAQAMDKSFDQVADAWERGVHELGEKYGIPEKDFLLWGACGAAQWAHRLCLRKPEYFLAIDIHIPGSFDKPTPEAAKVLWCLTTGERYAGYERSLRFADACKKLGYPMVYKAIVGLGHSGHPDATAMGFKFFEFALTQKALRDEYDEKMGNAFEKAKISKKGIGPWPDSFRSPPFYGDAVNQEIYPSSQVAMIPEGFRVPLPTKEIADIWGRSH